MYIKFYYITLADVKILLHCKMKLLLQLVVSVRKHYSVRYIGPVKNTLSGVLIQKLLCQN